MKIIIAGAGEVGLYLAKQLSSEEHNITVIDIDINQLNNVNDSAEVLTIHGSSTSIALLKEAQVEKANLVVAVTSSESVNINTAIISKKLGAAKTVARVANDEYISANYQDMFRSLGIDHLIYPEELAAIEIVKLIERAAATDIVEFDNGALSLIGLRLDKNASVIRKTIKETAEEFSDANFRIVAIQRRLKTLMPSGNDIFLPDDQIFVITTHESIEQILHFCGKKNTKIENIMILGGGKIGRKTAKLLEKFISVKLIESNKDKSIELADYLTNTLIIQGDGRDIDLLAQESIIDMDAFIALTEDSETNIITSLMARHLKVDKTITLINNIDYLALTHTIGLDTLINKKLIAANNISKYIRQENILSIATLQGVDAEVFEYKAKHNSAITKAPIKNLKIPDNVIIGGVIRDGKGIITVGDTQIEPEDRVVIFSLPGSINKIEKLF